MADLTQIHKHHIVPKYRCEELGIDPDFDGNTIDTTRKQHSLIHWGYYCSDLSLLLEVCSPEQWVQDMIPLGDKRDNGAAVFIALGEVEGIVPLSGKDHPNYKHGRTIGGAYDKVRYDENKEKLVAYAREYYNKNKEGILVRQQEYRKSPEYKEEKKVYDKKYRNENREKINTQAREYRNENKDYFREYLKEYYIKNKEERKIYYKKYRNENREKINTQARERYKLRKNKNSSAHSKMLLNKKEYYEKHKERILSNEKKRRVRKKLERATATLDNFM